jgi:predicted DNA binding protein
MVTISDVMLPGDSFALGKLLEENPDISVEIERLVPLEDRLLPFFWVSNGSQEHIREALESQSFVASVEHLTEVNDRHLYQVTWTSEVDGVIDALLETDGSILEGQGIAGKWDLRLRFPEHENLHRFSDICAGKEINLTVRSVYNPHVPPIKEQLTKAQWQTLFTAYEIGYFDVPRAATLSELGEHLGVSKQATSTRLRRAMREVVEGLIYEP